MAKRKVVKRATPVELFHEIYRQQGWQRQPGESMVHRVQQLYTVTICAETNRYVATLKEQAGDV